MIWVIDKIRQLQSGSQICLSWVWLHTELDDKKILLPINHNHFNFQKNKYT